MGDAALVRPQALGAVAGASVVDATVTKLSEHAVLLLFVIVSELIGAWPVVRSLVEEVAKDSIAWLDWNSDESGTVELGPVWMGRYASCR